MPKETISGVLLRLSVRRRSLSVIGSSPEFADMFEYQFTRQGKDDDQDIETTLETGWNLLAELPEA